MDGAKPETYLTWQPGYWLMQDVATGEWVFVRGDLLPNPKRWDRPSNQAKQGPLDAFWADDTQLAANAPPGAANAARRVFRKVTEWPGRELCATWNGERLESETDSKWVEWTDVLPPEALAFNHRYPRGTFRVVIEFTPDEPRE